ncbi:hypothetical protein [Paenibacillus dakarensis]|nr:hypothetical protein [Paenibacillus dakarensis]
MLAKEMLIHAMAETVLKTTASDLKRQKNRQPVIKDRLPVLA